MSYHFVPHFPKIVILKNLVNIIIIYNNNLESTDNQGKQHRMARKKEREELFPVDNTQIWRIEKLEFREASIEHTTIRK